MMNPGHGIGPGLAGGSSSGWKAAEVVSNQFPAGLRVLVVDDDPTCLMILEKMLRTCLYKVTKCNRAEIALSLLRKNRNGFDIVISDVHMPDMDGFKLLEHVGLEMDLPVIMMSADESKNVVMKGVTHGACDYLIKPVRMEALKNIWQHVVRKRRNEWSVSEHSGSIEEGGQQQKLLNDEAENNSSLVNEGSSSSNWRNTKKRKDEEGDEQEEKEDASTLKKPRVVWSVELHQQFVVAVNQLGVDKAVPKKILELMNVPGLSRENVASHLQKYRIYLRRIGGVSQHQGNLNNSFMTSQEANFDPLSSLNGFDLQALAVAGQLPAQSLAQLQAAGLGRPAAPRPGIPVPPLVDQRNIFSFENPKIRFGEGQPQPPQHLNSGTSVNNKQMNLLHGIPMEPKQLAGLQSIGSGGMNMQLVGPRGGQNGQSGSMLMPVGQQLQQPRGQNSHSLFLPNNASGSSGIPDIVSRRNSNLPGNSRGVPSYNPVAQQTNLMFNNFPSNQNAELPGNSFPLASACGIPIPTSKPYQEEVSSSDSKVSTGFVPSYDIFNDLQQHNNKSQDWDLHNVGLAFDAPQHSQGNLDAASAFSVSEGYSSSTQRNGQSINALAGEGTGHGNVQQNVGQHLSSVYVDNSTRVKSERASEMGCPLFQEQYNQEDLMSALLKQQEGIPPAENEFDFDGYSLDNIPV